LLHLLMIIRKSITYLGIIWNKNAKIVQPKFVATGRGTSYVDYIRSPKAVNLVLIKGSSSPPPPPPRLCYGQSRYYLIISLFSRNTQVTTYNSKTRHATTPLQRHSLNLSYTF
jgi:hypothetical protein